MRVMVTGGTGFVGSHTVAALHRDGHHVRVFARSVEKVGPTLAPLGVDVDRVEVVEGDLRDEVSVARALDGSDAVVHAASVYSLDSADADVMSEVNLEGVRAVVGRAVELGLDPVVHVSSVVALVDDRVDQHLTPDSAVGTSKYPYSGSKAAQEAYVRSLQDDGAPVVTTYPGGVWGPHDPYDGESTQQLRSILDWGFTFCPTGAVTIADVRDVAAVHAALVRPGQGPRRVMAGGHTIAFRDLVREVASAAGTRRPTIPVPGRLLRAVGRLADRLAPRIDADLPVSAEAAWLATKVMHADDSATTAALGVEFRPTRVTIRDQYAWMREAGRLDR